MSALFFLALAKTGKSKAATMATTAITASNSVKVKPCRKPSLALSCNPESEILGLLIAQSLPTRVLKINGSESRRHRLVSMKIRVQATGVTTVAIAFSFILSTAPFFWP
jgi:hypothetical protein